MVKRVLMIAFGSLLLLASGCDSGQGARIDRLEKQVDELKTEVKRNGVAADFDAQAKCSRDAKGWFNENWAGTKNAILLTYTNHYNKAQNKCFILVEYHYSFDKSNSWVNNMSLWDVYENAQYGKFSENHMIILGPNSQTRELVLTCNLLSDKCKTIDEFNSLLQPYMNN
jgi:hypothetical protein